jgi:hypothetical protein
MEYASPIGTRACVSDASTARCRRIAISTFTMTASLPFGGHSWFSLLFCTASVVGGCLLVLHSRCSSRSSGLTRYVVHGRMLGRRRKLNDKWRRLLLQVKAENRTQDAIAAMMGLAQQTISYQLKLLQGRLRPILM